MGYHENAVQELAKHNENMKHSLVLFDDSSVKSRYI